MTAVVKYIAVFITVWYTFETAATAIRNAPELSDAESSGYAIIQAFERTWLRTNSTISCVEAPGRKTPANQLQLGVSGAGLF
jgi:hypothetical protein